MAAVKSKIYFWVQVFEGCCHLRRWKSIYMPNFNEISQSMAEIKLLPVSEKERPPY